MHVIFFGAFRTISNEKMITIKPVPDLKTLFDYLIHLYGVEMKNLLFINGELRKDVSILRNGIQIRKEEMFNQTLLEEDTIYFFPAIVGG